MTTLVWHVPGNRELDLSEADHRLVTGLRGAGELLCLESASGQGELRVEHVRGRYRAVHVGGDDGAEPGRCGGGPHEILPVTDEHRQRWDYWHRAGDDAGHPSEVGRDLVGSGPQDVAIHGPVPTGVQVRASQVSSATARSRATRSRRAGWLPLWFTAADRSPSWFHRVPSAGCNRVSWDHLPPRGTAVATGLKRVVAARCAVDSFDRCPVAGRGHCAASTRGWRRCPATPWTGWRRRSRPVSWFR